MADDSVLLRLHPATPVVEAPDVDAAESRRFKQSTHLPNQDDAATTKVTPTTSTRATTDTKQPSAEPLMPKENPLHDYSTYTYGITLFILSANDHNNLNGSNVSGLESWIPSYSLISSAGAYRAQRHSAFTEDFYIDNLRMSTVIGLNSMTRGSNAIEITFTIIEPYGITLLDRILEAAASVGSKNYLSQPYMLQVDFFGNDDLGKLHTPIIDLRKRVPIRFIDMKIKTGSKGTEYQIRAIPFNHQAFQETSVSTPANFEIAASTVGDFFATSASDTLSDKKQGKDESRETAQSTTEVDRSATAPTGSTVGANSYPGAWNAWHQVLVDTKKAGVANKIEVLFYDNIGAASIIDPRTAYSYRPMTGTGASNTKASAQGNNAEVGKSTPTNSFDPSRMLFNIPAGTSIIDVINIVVRNSSYIKDQVIDPMSDTVEFPKDKVIDFFKIIPQVLLGEYDATRNTYATKTVYHVKKFSYYNSKHPNLPLSKPPGAVKKYDYIYTGKNKDILSFDIDFDAAFYVSTVAYREKVEKFTSAPAADDTETPEKDVTIPVRSTGLGQETRVVVSQEANMSGISTTDAKGVLVTNVMKSIYSSSRGDMIQVKLRILGDPHFVKQDDIYTNPGHGGYSDSAMMLNSGTLAMDNTEIFCNISFKTPVDMDEQTGLVRKDPRYSNSGFSGYYKIIKVDSEFNRGQFIQTLDLIRVFDKDQQDDGGREQVGQVSDGGSRDSGLPEVQVTTGSTQILPVYKDLEEPFESDVNTDTAVVADPARQDAVSESLRLQKSVVNYPIISF